jgi:DNA (cytosine-5)-methyltransferase 1
MQRLNIKRLTRRFFVVLAATWQKKKKTIITFSVDRMTIMEKINVFETFAGIGAQHKALEILKTHFNLNYKIVATSEWDIWANISYNAIHHDNKNIAQTIPTETIIEFLNQYTHSHDSKKPISTNYFEKQDRLTLELLYSSIKNCNNLGSITEIKGQELIDSVKDKRVDLITYSFPCQDLSVAGSFHGFNQGMKKGSGTRSGLLWEIERILRELKKIDKLPKYLLLENVKNMLSEKHKGDYIDWLRFLNKLGYNTKTFILNSGDYGIPQHRERVYGLSVRDDSFLDTFKETKNIRELDIPIDISEDVEIKTNLSNVLRVNYKDAAQKQEAAMAQPNKTPSRKKMFNENFVLYTKRQEIVDARLAKRRDLVYQKVSNQYFLNKTRTITTKQDRHPNAGVVDLKLTTLENKVGKANYRFLTPRETYLLMGFSDQDFDRVIKSGLMKQDILYRQAGNSIVVNVLVSIFYYLVVKRNE